MATATVQNETITVTDIKVKTMYLKVRFGLFGNIRKVPTSMIDVKQTEEQKQAEQKRFLHVSKKLLQSPELDAIKRADGEMRRWLYDICLPSLDAGVMFAPVLAVPLINAKLKEYRTQRESLVEAFLASYTDLRNEAREKLGNLFNPNDYPPIYEIDREFTFSWNYLQFSVPGELADIDSEAFDEEMKKAEAARIDAAEQIQALMRTTLAEMVNHLRDRLTDENGKPKRLHETAVTKMREFFETFSFRNVTNDTELAEQVAKAKELLSGVSIEALRTTDSLRSTLRASLSDISQALEPLVSARPIRKFRNDEE